MHSRKIHLRLHGNWSSSKNWRGKRILLYWELRRPLLREACTVTRAPAACAFALILCLLGAPAAADTLPLPQNLVDFTSEEGANLLIQAEARAAFWPLAAQFVTQENQAYCGVASLVMVLNALPIPVPENTKTSPYTAFTQGNFLNDATEKILPRAALLKQ